MRPWIPNTNENCNQIRTFAQRLGLTNSDCITENRWLGTTSYTLREAYSDLTNYYLARSAYFKHLIKAPEYNRDVPSTWGYFENQVLLILGSFHPIIRDALRHLTFVKDRGSTETHYNPLLNDQIGVAYFPKGITIFQPDDLTYLENESAEIQRFCIKDSSKDDCTPDCDKTLTVKIFAKKDEYFYCYINKRSPATLRRVFYKAFFTYCRVFEVENLLTEGLKRETFKQILQNIEYPTAESADIIVNALSNYIAEALKEQEENLIQDFASTKQRALNATRKENLDRTLKNCQRNLATYEANFREALVSLKNAEKAVAEYSEVDFKAIQVFLQLIKDYPRTQYIGKVNQTNIQFQIEEPLKHTSSAVWGKYLTNTESEINQIICDYTYDHRKDPAFSQPTYDILRFCIQRFIKELFVDQKIALYTTCLLGMDSNTTSLDIIKYELTQTNCMPHPHIGTAGLTCWSEAKAEIMKALMNNDGETAFLQLTYALQQMSATDNVVSRKLVRNILHPNYANIAIYLRKGKEKRETFIEIIQEFIKDETNKINAIIDSESEG